jgi:hypothetical protein
MPHAELIKADVTLLTGSCPTLMAYDKNISPVGLYLGAYLFSFVRLKNKWRTNPEGKFASWENTVLVKASSLSVTD